MKRRIYGENTPKARRATKRCDEEARKHGFKDWYDWYETEMASCDCWNVDLHSIRVLIRITREEGRTN